MTHLINRLIRRARNGETELTIRPQQVRSLANHFVLSLPYSPDPYGLMVEGVVRNIRGGTFTIMGKPVRVLGAVPT